MVEVGETTTNTSKRELWKQLFLVEQQLVRVN
jgi:hypothetical protein